MVIRRKLSWAGLVSATLLFSLSLFAPRQHSDREVCVCEIGDVQLDAEQEACRE